MYKSYVYASQAMDRHEMCKEINFIVFNLIEANCGKLNVIVEI